MKRKYYTREEVDEIRMETIKDANQMNVRVFKLGLYVGMITGIVIVILVNIIT